MLMFSMANWPINVWPKAFVVLTGCLSSASHAVVHWSRWKALAVLIVATALMACCADLCTENIEPILSHSSISQVDLIAYSPSRIVSNMTEMLFSASMCSVFPEIHILVFQYFIGVTVLAMVPELPEIVNGIQFALQNNISLRLECSAVPSETFFWYLASALYF